MSNKVMCLRARLTVSDAAKLDFLCGQLLMTKSQVVRQLIRNAQAIPAEVDVCLDLPHEPDAWDVPGGLE